MNTIRIQKCVIRSCKHNYINCKAHQFCCNLDSRSYCECFGKKHYIPKDRCVECDFCVKNPIGHHCTHPKGRGQVRDDTPACQYFDRIDVPDQYVNKD